MGRKQLCCADDPGGRSRVLRNAIFWRRCRWASSGIFRPESELMINFLCSCSGLRTWTRTFALRSWLGPASLGLVSKVRLGYV
jgi:hypothetical protein